MKKGDLFPFCNQDGTHDNHPQPLYHPLSPPYQGGGEGGELKIPLLVQEGLGVVSRGLVVMWNLMNKFDLQIR